MKKTEAKKSVKSETKTADPMPRFKRPAPAPRSKVDDPVFAVGNVIISEEVHNGKKAKSPLMIYRETDEGFRLCDENNIALAMPYNEAALLELGYTIAGQIDVSGFKVDDSAEIESIETSETGEHVVTVVKHSGKSKPAPKPLTPTIQPIEGWSLVSERTVKAGKPLEFSVTVGEGSTDSSWIGLVQNGKEGTRWANYIHPADNMRVGMAIYRTTIRKPGEYVLFARTSDDDGKEENGPWVCSCSITVE